MYNTCKPERKLWEKDEKPSSAFHVNHGWVACNAQKTRTINIFTKNVIKEGDVSKKIPWVIALVKAVIIKKLILTDFKGRERSNFKKLN